MFSPFFKMIAQKEQKEQLINFVGLNHQIEVLVFKQLNKKGENMNAIYNNELCTWIMTDTTENTGLVRTSKRIDWISLQLLTCTSDRPPNLLEVYQLYYTSQTINSIDKIAKYFKIPLITANRIIVKGRGLQFAKNKMELDKILPSPTL